jgi:phenylpyruvate tautomerase PptA (4-oxalocrotonate tautomerase family)
MPIVEVELVTDDEPGPGLAGLLADEIGRAMNASEGSTWVRLRTLPRDHYGESGGPVPEGVQPVFVTVTTQDRPAADQLSVVVERMTSSVARTTGHPRQNIHVIFAPDAAGRVAFGGRVVQ